MTKWHGGKGSSPRPKTVSEEEYANRWDAIFGRDLEPSNEKDTDEDGEVLLGKPIVDLDKSIEND